MQIVELIASSYNRTGRSLTLVSSLSSAQHWALGPLLDWSTAGPVPRSRTSPVVLDPGRWSATVPPQRQVRIGGIPDAPAIHSA